VADTLTTTSDTGVFTRDQVEMLSARKGEPEWLLQHRLEAFDRFAAAPMPTMREETWRYTDLGSALSFDAYDFAAETKPVSAIRDLPAVLVGEIEHADDHSGRMVQVDGSVVLRELSDELREKGVVFTSLDVAVEEHPELVRKYLGTALRPEEAEVSADTKFGDLNTAFTSGGTFVYVPKGVRIDAPLRVWRTITRAGVAVFPRTVIVAEDEAEVSVVDQMVSEDAEGGAFCVASTEIIGEELARVNYIPVQRWGYGTIHLSTDRVLARRDARITSLHVTLGGALSRVDAQCRMEGPGSHVDLLGLYLAEGKQHIDHETLQDHLSPHAASNLLFKGALMDEGHGVFRGMIRVAPGAQRTNAYQTNRNLLLSNSARADSLPNLEIGADDVRCSHAATVGQLDKEEMFYLMSRGIPKEEATRLVVFGFFGEVLEQLELEGVRKDMYGLVERKLLRNRR